MTQEARAGPTLDPPAKRVHAVLATMMPTVAGGGAVVHPVSQPTHTTDDDDATADDATKECFICTKPVEEGERVAPATAEGFPCNCLAHHKVHAACFHEWHTKHGTCPFCRSAGVDTDAIRLHVRETVATVQHEAEEAVRRKNRRLVVVGALSACAILCVFAFLLLHHNSDHEDDDWQHTHDDDHATKDSTYTHTQGATPGVWHLSRE